MAVIWRVRDRTTFIQLRRLGRRVRSGPISVTWAPVGSPVDPPRVAYAVGRAVGGAVVRNRVRRRLAASMAARAATLAPGAYLVGAGAPAAAASSQELDGWLRDSLTTLAERRDRASVGSGVSR